MASSNPADKFARAALVTIDVQNAIDAAYHASHGPRNIVDAEMNIAKLLATWRKERRPLIHVRHDSTFPGSAYWPGGQRFQERGRTASGLSGTTALSRRGTRPCRSPILMANTCTIVSTDVVLGDREHVTKRSGAAGFGLTRLVSAQLTTRPPPPDR